MMHIVFEEKGAAVLKDAQKMDDSLAGEVIALEDDWSAGPLTGFIRDGQTISRKEWLLKHFRFESREQDVVSKTDSYLRENSEAVVWLWIAPNARDVCGYYYLIGRLRKYSGRIFTIWLNNLPFLNEQGQIFYPTRLHEIPPKEFLKAKRLSQEVTGAVFETDPDEWEKLKAERCFLRLLDGRKKIVSKPAGYYDKILINRIKNDWQKSDKIVRESVKEIKEHVNEKFLFWRLRELTAQGLVEVNGDPENSDNFEAKLYKTGEIGTDE